jgi:hypothetical protein
MNVWYWQCILMLESRTSTGAVTGADVVTWRIMNRYLLSHAEDTFYYRAMKWLLDCQPPIRGPMIKTALRFAQQSRLYVFAVMLCYYVQLILLYP